MKRALRLAARARGRTSPNPMVGCVLVAPSSAGGVIVGEGYHHRAGLAHAEVEALRAAGDRARGATAYVTLEPCNHHGRTGPCAEALIAAGVARVVVAMADPNPRVRGGGAERLRAAGIPVEVGLCEAEARALNAGFVRWVVSGRPRVTLKAAVTLDGRLAASSGDARWVSGEASRREAHRLRDACDAILVGAGTVRADDPALTTRLDPEARGRRRGRTPLRVVLDGRLAIPEAARLVGEGTLILATEEAPADAEARLRARGVEVLRLPASASHQPGEGVRLDLGAVLDELGRRGVLELLVEGGGAVHGAFLAAGLVDRVVVFVAPKLLGDGVPLLTLPAGTAPPAKMADAWRLEGVTVRQLGDDAMIVGDLVRADTASRS